MGRQVGGWVGYKGRAGVGAGIVGGGGVGMRDGGGGYAMKFERRTKGARGGNSHMRQSGYGQSLSQSQVGTRGGGVRMVQDGPAGRQEQIIGGRGHEIAVRTVMACVYYSLPAL